MAARKFSKETSRETLNNWQVPVLGFDSVNDVWVPPAVSPSGALAIGGVDASGNVSSIGASSAAAATGTLTSDATKPSDTDTVTIGTTVYTFVSLVQGTTTLTSDNTAPSDASTVTIGNKTYTFKTTLTPTEGEVLINVTADAALLNLIRAINHTGTPDTDYKCAAAHTQVSAASSVTAHAFLITALDAGTAGNVAVSASTTAPSAHITFTAATLTGGTDPTVAGTVKIGISAAVSLDNLKAAVNLDAGQGTLFFVTAAHPTVTATTNTDTTQLFVARTAGAAGNSIASTDTSSHLSWGGSVLSGGTDSSLVIGSTLSLTSTVVFTDTNARATGDYCGTDTVPQAFTNAVRFNGGTAKIRSLAIVDATTTAAVALELWIFGATFTAPADNAAWTVTDAQALTCLGVIPIPTTKWYASAANKAYSDDTLNLIVRPLGTSLFYAIVARGTTPAWTTAAGLQLTLGIEQN